MLDSALQAPVFAPAKRQKPPAPKGPIFLYFVDVSEEDVARVAAATTKAEVRQLLQEYLKIQPEDGHRSEIMCDFHFHNYAFCVSLNFTSIKISTFLSIMKNVLEEAVARKLYADDAFNVFKDWLLKHSVERPPWSVGIFTQDDLKDITKYVHSTFFRHYRLYMYTYMAHSSIDVRLDRRCVGGLAPPRPLEALSATCEIHSGERSADDLFNDVLKELKVDPKTHADWYPKPEAASPDEASEEAPEAQDRASIIKRKVEAGVKQLLVKFEDKLKAQDEQFRAMIDE